MTKGEGPIRISKLHPQLTHFRITVKSVEEACACGKNWIACINEVSQIPWKTKDSHYRQKFNNAKNDARIF
jgi:hypothetical protein